jgi:histidine triad (HIT) family protein
MNQCLFCRIDKGEIPGRIIHRDEDVLAFEDVAPQAPVHVLVIPRRHIASVAELGPSERGLGDKLLEIAVRIAGEMGLTENGYRIVTNTGPAAGQSVDHLHFHLLGGRPMGWPPG